MKTVVTHHSPDLDAITSVWLIRKFLPGWDAAEVKFVPAGQRLGPDTSELIHVDTGLGKLDHHQTRSTQVSAASLTFNYVRKNIGKHKLQAIERMVRVVVDIDHFKESTWPDALADYQEFSLIGIIEGIRNQFPGEEKFMVEFMSKCLDALLLNFENRIYAEKELKKGVKFNFGKIKGIGFETINDTVLPLSQKAGYKIVLRRDPRKGYVRIKARPDTDIDLTPVYDKLKKLDSQATWFLHVSRKMLLNGTTKNPSMKPTKLSLEKIIEVIKSI